LLAAELAHRGDVAVQHLLLWQPVLDGKLYLNQHLRLRLASQMVHDAGQETGDSLRARLAAGETLEVAGYPLTGPFADALGRRRMADFRGLERCRIDWLEVVSKPEQALALPSRKQVDALVAAGARLQVATAVAPPIWQLQEREDAPDLQAASLRLMEAAACTPA